MNKYQEILNAFLTLIAIFSSQRLASKGVAMPD